MSDYEASVRPPLAGTRMALSRAKLSLPTIRRAAGMFEGNHSSIFTGHGHDFEDLIEYKYGDDVADIDWKSSARAGHPIIRRFERESDVFTQLVVDTGIEMRAAAPSGESKLDLALQAADLLGFLATNRGDRLGLVFGEGGEVKRYPARHGNSHLEFTLDALARRMRFSQGSTDVSALLKHILGLPQPRSLLLIIADEHWPTIADEEVVRRIRTRHEAILMQIADMPLTADNIDTMADIENRMLIPQFVRDDAVLREMVTQKREQRRAETAAILRSTGLASGRVESSADIVPVLFDLLRGQSAKRR
ncbi:MAG: DUF58 domain-containing protein [Actinomycetaceae bacterium]|nr:DUF58 domain-containing protein [Actinomycetaceae bacterium]